MPVAYLDTFLQTRPLQTIDTALGKIDYKIDFITLIKAINPAQDFPSSWQELQRNFYLAEHHLYGSSRLGISAYWPQQFNASWDYVGQTSDLIRLQERLPWLSSSYQALIEATNRQHSGTTLTSQAMARYVRGQRYYQLANHLGNVQATVSDQRYTKDLNADNKGDRPLAALPSVYDYYPFGMPMPGRTATDTGRKCATITTTVLVPVKYSVAHPLSTATVTSMKAAYPTQNNAAGGVDVLVGSQGATTTLSNLLPDTSAQLTLQLIPYEYIDEVTVNLTNTATGQLLGGTIINNGEARTISFTPPANDVRLSMSFTRREGIPATDIAFTLKVVGVEQWPKTPQNITTVVCNDVEDKYRFGFNGQEKDNEVKGIGNSLNYKERMEDVRLGRFMSVDKLAGKYPYLSTYQFAGNNPIKFIDVDGLEPAENPATLKQQNPTAYPGGTMFLTTATDVKTQKTKEFWVFHRELPNMQGHEYLYHTGSGGAAGWSVFWNDAANAAAGRKATDQTIRAFHVGLITGLTLPLGGAGLSAGLGMRVLAAATDLGGQWLTNGRDFGKVNLTSLGSSALTSNPFIGEAIGQGFNYSYKDGFTESYVAGGISSEVYMLNVGIASGVGLGIKGLQKAISTSGGTQSSIGVKKDLLMLGNRGARAAITGGNAAMGTGQTTVTNAAQKATTEPQN